MVRKGHWLKLIDIANKEGEIIFSRLEKTFKKKSLVDKFWDNLTKWEESVTVLAQKRKYLVGGIALPIIMLTASANTDFPPYSTFHEPSSVLSLDGRRIVVR